MPKVRLKKWLPKPHELKKNKAVALFAPFLADARLWQLNRKSLVYAVYIGVMCAFFPLPGQMLLAIFGAFWVRCNVPMAVALTWLTNPFTALPIYWLAYGVGAQVLGEPAIGLSTIGQVVADTSRWLLGDGANPFVMHQFFSFKAFGLGLLISGLLCSMILGLSFNWFWQWHTARSWRKRQGYNPHAPKFTKPKKIKKPNL